MGNWWSFGSRLSDSVPSCRSLQARERRTQARSRLYELNLSLRSSVALTGGEFFSRANRVTFRILSILKGLFGHPRWAQVRSLWKWEHV